MVATSADDPLRIRWLEQGDRGFVASTWINSYKEVSSLAPSILSKHPVIVDTILDGAGDVFVLCSKEKEKVLHGFVAGSARKHLHYVFIAKDLRRRGFARRLVTALLDSYKDPIECSHESPIKRFLYNPFLLAELR